jgi:putative MATE family efflux protein
MSQKANTNKAILIQGPVGKTLVELTWPMVFGVLGIVAFNLVDTFFVGKLGIQQLAALSFTFPVVLGVSSLAMGLGIATSSVVSRAIGEGDFHQVKRLTTDSLVLSVLIVVVFVVAGLLTLEPVFSMLGATSELLPLIEQYMRIWYLGMVFIVVPMVGNNAIRATGDTKTPSAVMLVAVAVNLVLDPLLIFGIGPFPRLELAGAAITTVFARATMFMVAVYILAKREKMITVRFRPIKAVVNSWVRILYIGLPAAGTRIIIPVAIGIITRVVAGYGPAAVAAFGVASRIEFFALAVLIALASVLGPFIGQNWGAGKPDRVKLSIKISSRFAVIWGFSMFVFLAAAARPVASVFNDNPDVISGIVLYLRVVPLAFGLEGVLVLSAAALNVLNKPLHAAGLIFAQMLLFCIPMVFLGSYLFGLTGVYGALALVYALGGIAAYLLLRKVLSSLIQEDLSLNAG